MGLSFQICLGFPIVLTNMNSSVKDGGRHLKRFSGRRFYLLDTGSPYPI